MREVANLRQLIVWAVTITILSGCSRSSRRNRAPLASFEGTLKVFVPDATSREPLLVEVKGNRARWDLVPTAGESAGYRIYDGNARRLFTIIPTQKLQFVDDAEARDAAGVGQGATAGDWAFAPLGDGRVADQPCERFRATRGSDEFLGCATKAIVALPMARMFPLLAARAPFLETLEEEGRLVLALAAAPGPGLPAKPLLNSLSIVPSTIDDARLAVPDFPVAGPSHAGLPALR